jgi:hypothetical protein
MGKQPKTYLDTVDKLFHGGSIGAKLNFQAIQETFNRQSIESDGVVFFNETTGNLHLGPDHHFNTTSTSPRGKSKERKSLHQEISSPYT